MTEEENKIKLKANEYLAELVDYLIDNPINKKSMISTLDQIDEIIMKSLRNNTGSLYSTDIKVFLSPLSDHGLANLFIHIVSNIKSNKSKPFMVNIAERIIIRIQSYMEICLFEEMYNKTYFDIQNLLFSTYKISIVLIILISENDELNGQFREILYNNIFSIFYLLISRTITNYKAMQFNLRDYMTIFYYTLTIMIIKNKETPKFTTIIEKWIEELISLNKRHFHDYIKKENINNIKYKKNTYEALLKIYPYVYFIKDTLHKEMPNSKEFIRLKELLDEYENYGFINYDEIYPSYWQSPSLGYFTPEFKNEVNRLINILEDEISSIYSDEI